MEKPTSLTIITGETRKVIKVLWTEEEIKKRTKQIAKEIAIHYLPILKESHKKLLLIGILNGAMPFLEALRIELAKLLDPDQIRYDFMSISSYNETTSSELQIRSDLKNPINGNHVLIVEDIIDTGHTFEFLKAALNSKKPNSVECIVLIDKAGRREVDGIKINYVCFELSEPSFVFGFGLDWEGVGRNYSFIGELESID